MRTGQSAQIRLASRDDPPFSGKKTSGSWSRQRARSCHGTKWCTASPRNYIVVILHQAAPEKQVATPNFGPDSSRHHRGNPRPLEHHMQAVGADFHEVMPPDLIGQAPLLDL